MQLQQPFVPVSCEYPSPSPSTATTTSNPQLSSANPIISNNNNNTSINNNNLNSTVVKSLNNTLNNNNSNSNNNNNTISNMNNNISNTIIHNENNNNNSTSSTLINSELNNLNARNNNNNNNTNANNNINNTNNSASITLMTNELSNINTRINTNVNNENDNNNNNSNNVNNINHNATDDSIVVTTVPLSASSILPSQQKQQTSALTNNHINHVAISSPNKPLIDDRIVTTLAQNALVATVSSTPSSTLNSINNSTYIPHSQSQIHSVNNAMQSVMPIVSIYNQNAISSVAQTPSYQSSLYGTSNMMMTPSTNVTDHHQFRKSMAAHQAVEANAQLVKELAQKNYVSAIKLAAASNMYSGKPLTSFNYTGVALSKALLQPQQNSAASVGSSHLTQHLNQTFSSHQASSSVAAQFAAANQAAFNAAAVARQMSTMGATGAVNNNAAAGGVLQMGHRHPTMLMPNPTTAALGHHSQLLRHPNASATSAQATGLNIANNNVQNAFNMQQQLIYYPSLATNQTQFPMAFGAATNTQSTLPTANLPGTTQSHHPNNLQAVVNAQNHLASFGSCVQTLPHLTNVQTANGSAVVLNPYKKMKTS